jgi:hypothetical protein
LLSTVTDSYNMLESAKLIYSSLVIGISYFQMISCLSYGGDNERYASETVTYFEFLAGVSYVLYFSVASE